MDWDQSQLLLPQPHNLNPDIHHMCGSSGKMNSTWEYMVRKFIAHAWDEPSGAGWRWRGDLPSPWSLSLVSIRQGRAISQTIQGGLVQDLLANNMTQSWRRNQFPHIWDFPTAAMGQHSTSVTRPGHILWNSAQINNNKYVCVYLHEFMKEGEGETAREKESALYG